MTNDKQSTSHGGDWIGTLTRSETTSAVILVVAVVAAVVWANVGTTYEHFWTTDVSIGFGPHHVAATLREWINSGLMTIFFVIVGLEARREFDLGELRDRARIVPPLVTGLLAMALPAFLYLAITAGTPGAARGWGAALSTDTAFALGFVTLLAGNRAERLRLFLLTVLVVDDLVSVMVAAVVYTDSVVWWRVGLALLLFLAFAVALRAGVNRPLLYSVIGFGTWASLFGSGIDPVLSGLAIGMLASAYAPRRDRLDEAARSFRLFREEPTPELARSANAAVIGTQSPNARLRAAHLPWSSLLIVPLFGVANAGVVLRGGAFADALRSPITWGIVVAFVVGKPLAYLLAARGLTLTGRGTPVPVTGLGLLAVGTTAAAPFTLSLLIADRAFSGVRLNEAKTGTLIALVLSLAITSLVVARLNRLNPQRRARALQGDGTTLLDPRDPVTATEHIRGAEDADVTIVEYGDFECPHCGRAEAVARAELASDEGVRYVWRHLPLHDVHPHAQLAAEAAEAAAAQGAFWQMHDRLLDAQDDLTRPALVRHAAQLGLDVDRFAAELDDGRHRDRVRHDEDAAAANEVAGTPTFFINGVRHYGAYDAASIELAVREARQRLLAGLP